MRYLDRIVRAAKYGRGCGRTLRKYGSAFYDYPRDYYSFSSYISSGIEIMVLVGAYGRRIPRKAPTFGIIHAGMVMGKMLMQKHTLRFSRTCF